VILKRIAQNFSWLLLGNILSQGIVFVAFIRIASLLPYDDFGRFAFAQAIINFLTRFTEFGLETVAVRRVTKNQDHKFLFEQIIIIRSCLSFIIVLPIAILFVTDSESPDKLILLLLSLSMIGISFSSEWYYLAAEKMSVVAVIRVVRAIAFYVPLELVLVTYPSSIVVSSVYSLSFISIHIIIIAGFVLTSKVSFKNISIQKARLLIKESFPIGISSSLMQIPFYFGTFIIGTLFTKDDVGKYSAAYRPILAFWSFGIMALYNAIFPIMNNYSKDIRLFTSFIFSLTRIFLIGSIIMLVTLYPFSNSIIHVLYSGKYDDSIFVFELSLFIIAVVLSRTAIEYSLLSMQLQKYYSFGIVMVSTLYMILCTLGGIFFGIHGVIFASIFSEIIYTGYVIAQVKRYDIETPYFMTYMKSIVVMFIVFAGAHNPFEIHPILNGMVLMVLFTASVFGIKLLVISDIKKLLAFAERG
jgi:PST family polysaccharide transporter